MTRISFPHRSSSPIVRDKAFVRAWAASRPLCYLRHLGGCEGRIETAHIRRGSRRSDEAWNLTRLCARHHDHFDGRRYPRIKLWQVVLAKWRHDPQEMNLEALR